MKATAQRTDRVQRRLFLDREYEAIKGKGNVVFWLLYAIILMALTAVAIGRTGLDHLQEQMDDPFTTWVDIPASNTTVGDHYVSLLGYLQSCANTGKFNARQSSGSYSKSGEGWVTDEDGVRYWEHLRYQSFGYYADQELLESVLGKENLVQELIEPEERLQAATFKDGIIITRSLMDELGYSFEELKGKRLLLRLSMHFFPVRVLAVVQTVPGRRDVLMEHGLLLGMNDELGKTILYASTDTVVVLLACKEREEAEGAAKVIGGMFQVPEDSVSVAQNELTLSHGWQVKCKGTGSSSLDVRSREQGKLLERTELRDLVPVILNEVLYNVPDPSDDYGREDPKFDNLTITFASLDSIGDFQRDLLAKFKVDLNLDRIRSMENFSTVSNLSKFLVLALVLFSALSILVFLYNLLKNHLERIKMNLGTFMAFGLSGRFLFTGYMHIIVKLLFRAMLAAGLTLAAVQLVFLMLREAGVKVSELLAGLRVVDNPWIYLTLGSLMLASFVIFRWQLLRFLNNSPGDLIHARK